MAKKTQGGGYAKGHGRQGKTGGVAGLRATTGGGLLHHDGPLGKYMFSDYPVMHWVFNTPVGQFDVLKDAIEACRAEKIPLPILGPSPIQASLQRAPARNVRITARMERRAR